MPQDPGACGRGCAPVPQILCGGEDCLSEASSAAHDNRDRGKGTRRAAPGRQWFWVLLPKQKDLVGGGETPQGVPFLSCGERDTPLSPSQLSRKSNDPGCPIKSGMTERGVPPRIPLPPSIPECSFPKMNRTHNLQSTRTRPHRTIDKPTNKKNNKKRNTKGLTYAFVKRRILRQFYGLVAFKFFPTTNKKMRN